MKKTLAILLSLALVLCMMPGAAFAETTPVATTAVTLSATSGVYSGAAHNPTITVVGTNAEGAATTLTSDQYTVQITKGGVETGLVDAGEYTITVTPKETYPVQTATYTINKYDLTANGISASVPDQTTALTTDNIEDNLTFHDSTGKAIADTALVNMLKAQLTTTVGTPTNNKYPVTFALSENLTGSIAAIDFDVLANINGATVVANATYGAKLEGGTLNAGAYDGTTRTISNLFYLTDGTNSIANHYTVSATFNGKAVTTAKDAGTYTITANGIGNTYAGSKDITMTIAKRDASLAAKNVTVDAISGQYSSDQFDTIVPVVRDVRLGVLSAGTDYNYTVTSGKVTIDFKGNYSGSQTVPFTVVADANDIAKIYSTLGIKIDGKDLASYVKNPSLYYNGASQAPYITVAKLSSSYYTIEYRYTDAAGKAQVVSYPKDAATYKIYMVGKNGYGGEKELGEMTIQPFKTDWVEVTASAGYTTSTPYVYVRSLDGTITFVQDKDYKITNTYVSSATNKVKVYISTMGNIESDLLTAEYSIIGKNIAYCTVEFATGSKQYNNYTGTAIKPSVKVRDGYTLLSAGSDYTVTYKDAAGKVVAAPKDAGTYIIEITGKGAYSGTTTMYYYINGTDISSYTVTLKADSAKADGTAKTPVISSVKYGYYSTLSSADYTVTYEDPQGNTVNAYSIKAPGTYKVIVTGKGGYSGSTYAYFTVVGTPQEIYIPKTSYKVYKDSASFKITATATGDGTGFSFVSSDPTVASVSSTGIVTIHKLGRAKITVTTTGMKKSDPASDDVYVKVYPDKAYLTKKPWTEGKKGSLRVRWETQDDTTKYQIRYSTTKNFKSYKTKTVTASELYDTQSTRLTGLKSNTKYYIKVRAVKEVKNDYGETLKYYGTWSNWRSATTK